MKPFAIDRFVANPELLSAVLFDVDHTLYRDEVYGPSHNPLLIARLAREFGWSVPDAADRVEQARVRLSRVHGRNPSMGECFLEFGISIEQNVEWRKELMHPEAHLRPDQRLAATLRSFGSRPLIAVTNNPTEVGWRTLRALEVDRLFADLFGLDACFRSKPDPCIFERALNAAGVAASQVIVVGDRFEIDLEPILNLGGGAVLVESMEDVYHLPQLLHLESVAL